MNEIYSSRFEARSVYLHYNILMIYDFMKSEYEKAPISHRRLFTFREKRVLIERVAETQIGEQLDLIFCHRLVVHGDI